MQMMLKPAYYALNSCFERFVLLVSSAVRNLFEYYRSPD